jgi:hypothetical protein
VAFDFGLCGQKAEGCVCILGILQRCGDVMTDLDYERMEKRRCVGGSVDGSLDVEGNGCLVVAV